MPVSIWTGNNPKTDNGPEHYEITWTGRVLRLSEHNYYDDSDFFALVWDDDAGKPREVGYATTRGWTYKNRRN